MRVSLFIRVLLLAGFLSQSLPTFADLQVDSLRQQVAILIEQDQPFELMLTYETLGQHYYDHNEHENALEWYLKSLEIAEVLQNKHKQFFLLHQIGFIYYYPFDDYEQSLSYLLRANTISKGIASDSDRANNLSRIAEVYNNLGAYNLALDFQLEALNLSEHEQDTATMALGYRNLGALYWAQKQYDFSLSNFKRSLRFYRSLNLGQMPDSLDARRKAYDLYTCVASIGASYLELGHLDTALYYIQQSESLADSLNHEYGRAYSLALTGNIALARKEYNKALEYLNQAILSFKSQELRREAVSFSIQTAVIHLQTNQPYLAMAVLNEVEPVAMDLNSPTLLRDIFRSRAEAYEKMGNMSQAYLYLKQFIHLRDSLLNEERISQLAKVEHQYDIQEKDETIADLQKARDTSQRQMYLIVGISSLIFLLFLLYAVYQRNQSLGKINSILHQKNEEIRLQNERLGSSNDDLRQFAHVTSHDLREPLRSIGSFATLLRRRYYGQIDEDANEFIDFITKGVDRMDSLLTDLMAYSVVGIFQTDFAEVPINAVITEIIEQLNREKATQGARISIQNLPTIVANRNQMVQLFQHLIDNAIKFRSEHPPEIEISAEAQGEEYLFSVKDNGIGMPEAYQDKIFSLFLRLHNRKSNYKGTGIGLSICKKIVEQHKGKIWIESELNEGTTVFFSLPANLLNTDEPRKKSRRFFAIGN
ncbi:MAG: ATP-binding protein [Bacteroidota bacterium]